MLRIRTKPQHTRKPGLAVVALIPLLAIAGFALPAVLAVYLSADSRTLGPRRAADLIEYSVTDGYDLAAVARGEATVPRLFLTRMPRDWRDLEQADKRKQAFAILVLPLVLQANEHVAAERQHLLHLTAEAKAGKAIAAQDQAWLWALADTYGTKSDDFAELARRVDEIPPSLALAQAAIESGWGASRFAIDGNALFGQWTGDRGNAMVPAKRDPGATHAIRRFPTLADSVASYYRNLNSHRAYAKFRKRRAAMRAAGKPLDGGALAEDLGSYSARGGAYIKAVRRVIADNELATFDTARLEPSTGPTQLGVLPTRR